MSSKPVKETPKDALPPEIASSPPPAYRGTTTGYDFYLQSIIEIQRSVGAIESSVKHLSDRNQAQESKLEKIEGNIHDLSKEIHGAKRIAWIVGAILSLVGAVGLVFLNKLLDVVVAYANAQFPKH